MGRERGIDKSEKDLTKALDDLLKLIENDPKKYIGDEASGLSIYSMRAKFLRVSQGTIRQWLARAKAKDENKSLKPYHHVMSYSKWKLIENTINEEKTGLPAKTSFADLPRVPDKVISTMTVEKISDVIGPYVRELIKRGWKVVISKDKF